MPDSHGGDWHFGRLILIAIFSALIGLLFDVFGVRGFIGTFAKVFIQEAAKEVIEKGVTPAPRKTDTTFDQDRQRERDRQRAQEEQDQRKVAAQRAAEEAEKRLREAEQAAAEERRRAAEADRRRIEIEIEQERQRRAAVERQQKEAEERRRIEDERRRQEAERRQNEAEERRRAEEARYFMFKICNHTPVAVAVAVEYFSPPDRDRVVKGWIRLQPGNCSTPERFLKGDFSFYANEVGGRNEWRGSSPICVEFPGPFTRVRGGGSQCAPNTLRYFTTQRVTDPELNINLNYR